MIKMSKFKNRVMYCCVFALTTCWCDAKQAVDAVYWKWASHPVSMFGQLTIEFQTASAIGYKELDKEEIAALNTMAESGNADAQAILSHFYLQHILRNDNKANVRILVKDIKDAKSLIDKAYASFLTKAKSGDAHACLNLAEMHEFLLLSTLSIAQDKQLELAREWGLKALDILGKKAEQGDEQAMKDIVRCYSYGIGCEKNPQKSFTYSLKLANLGNIYAIKQVGYAYVQSEGVERDFNEAIKWYTKAAEKGDVESCAEIAEIYGGRHAEFPQDAQKELEWRRLAATRGHAYSQYRMAISHCDKQIKERDEWLELAAKNDSCDAIKMLANMKMIEGKQHEGFLLLQKAADLNDADAQYSLGEAYEKGVGTAKDLNKAKIWYEKSAKKGNLEAKEKLENAQSAAELLGHPPV